MRKKLFGVAIDIGTTQIKGSLLDLRSKRELAAGSVPNEQGGFGPDVITRLQFATTKKEGLKELNRRTISAINKLLDKLAKEASIDKKKIRKILAVGNSVMYHLVLMVRPDSLAQAPFLPLKTKTQEKDANEMGIGIAEKGTFKFLANVSGFVGSDALAVILFTRIHKDKKYSLIMDMGTNGEIVLGSKDRILVSSCACGPAFEGRHIRPGSRLIDFISILLDKGVINRTGKMAGEKFIVYKKGAEEIYLTRQNVREAQLAKAALAAGIEVLRRRLGIDIKNVNRLYITGKFGTSIDIKNAKRIGLIPSEIPNNSIVFLKEGALRGAKKVLSEPKAEKEIGAILAKCEHVELHKDKDFQDIFAASMAFRA